MSMEEVNNFPKIAFDLEEAGLIWTPMFGDEVCHREQPKNVSILVDAAGLKPQELKKIYLWLPSVEQMVFQLEVRQAVLKHAGLQLSPQEICYHTIIESCYGKIESNAKTLRGSIGISLRELLVISSQLIH